MDAVTHAPDCPCMDCEPYEEWLGGDDCPDCGNPWDRPGIVVTGGDALTGPLGGYCENGFHARCDRPPRGWYCLGRRGHDGPCAAWPTRWTRLVHRLAGEWRSW